MKQMILSALLMCSVTTTPVCAQDVDTTQTITLREVRVSTPGRTRMKSDAMLTRIVASPLASAGTAEDVLARVPGLMRMQGEIQVIGKGAPIYYINGRRVHDVTELQRLSSHDIQDVEVISNPGASYDAQASAVIRIRTLRKRGEGFGVSLDARDEVSPRWGNNQASGTLALNYRRGAVDVFGGATADLNHLAHYRTEVNQTSLAQITHMQAGTTDMSQRYNTIKYNLGANWQPADDHSMGFRVERVENVKGITDFHMEDEVFRDGQLVDQLLSDTHTDEDGVDAWSGNVYYNGRVGRLGIDWNGDIYTTRQQGTADTYEQAWAGDRNVLSHNHADSRLLATKLVLSYPVWKGTLDAGTEMTWVRRNNRYDITESQIADDQSRVNESTMAGFVQYGAAIPHLGMLSAGLRYEHASMQYTNETAPELNLKRSNNHFFPSLSFATEIGSVQASLAYSARTRRPDYRLLRSNIEYNNRFTWSTGDPKLRNEIRHDLNLSARWKWLSGILYYNFQKHGIYDWTYPIDDQGTVLISWVNLSKPIHRVSGFVNVSPTVGIWQPNFTVGVQKQWLSFNLVDPRESTGLRKVTYNRPMFIFETSNVFRLPTHNEDGHGAWQFELNSELTSSAHYGNAELKNWYWLPSLVIQKSFLPGDALVLRLTVADPFHTAHYNVGIDLGNYQLSQTPIFGKGRDVYDQQRIGLSLRYRWNTVKSKYKGTGAGSDARSRM